MTQNKHREQQHQPPPFLNLNTQEITKTSFVLFFGMQSGIKQKKITWYISNIMLLLLMLLLLAANHYLYYFTLITQNHTIKKYLNLDYKLAHEVYYWKKFFFVRNFQETKNINDIDSIAK